MITMADPEVNAMLTELGRAQARIAELEAEVVRLKKYIDDLDLPDEWEQFTGVRHRDWPT
jgi:hypothetical protein